MRATLPASLSAALALALPAPAAAGTPGSADVAALQTGLSAPRALRRRRRRVRGAGDPRRVAQAPGSLHPARRRHARRARRLRLAPARQPADPRGLLGLGRRRTPVSPRLARLPSGTMDGTFGDRTTAALMRFQRWAESIRSESPGRRRSPRCASRSRPRRSGSRGRSSRAARTGSARAGRASTPASTIPRSRARRCSPPATDGRHAGAIAGYGNLVVLAHGSGVTSWYGHLSRILVSPGQRVARGTTVGLVGATGDATGPHLHFEVRVRDAAVDPETAF